MGYNFHFENYFPLILLSSAAELLALVVWETQSFGKLREEMHLKKF